VSAPASAALRQRRHRERRARGARVIGVEIDADLVSLLTEIGLIGPDEIDDSHALGFALWMLLNEIAENHRDRVRESLSRVTKRAGASVESPN
jgi:hypothetical protein